MIFVDSRGYERGHGLAPARGERAHPRGNMRRHPGSQRFALLGIRLTRVRQLCGHQGGVKVADFNHKQL